MYLQKWDALEVNDQKHSELITQNPIEREQITSERILKQKDQIKLAHIERNLAQIRRKALFEIIDDYISFITTKVVGVGSLVIGVSELLIPNVIPIVISPPFTPLTLIGIGMGFLVKKQAISIMNYTLNILVQDNDEAKK